jgi:hypothetical protein
MVVMNSDSVPPTGEQLAIEKRRRSGGRSPCRFNQAGFGSPKLCASLWALRVVCCEARTRLRGRRCRYTKCVQGVQDGTAILLCTARLGELLTHPIGIGSLQGMPEPMHVLSDRARSDFKRRVMDKSAQSAPLQRRSSGSSTPTASRQVSLKSTCSLTACLRCGNR